ncbi:hypothetical protein [Cysteiniphilum litorale]|uniref:hypothetical protein n=1 Tax=Cysteiniphilum litorale TaxID=2056700 RepID=UPI003F8821BB
MMIITNLKSTILILCLGAGVYNLSVAQTDDSEGIKRIKGYKSFEAFQYDKEYTYHFVSNWFEKSKNDADKTRLFKMVALNSYSYKMHDAGMVEVKTPKMTSLLAHNIYVCNGDYPCQSEYEDISYYRFAHDMYLDAQKFHYAYMGLTEEALKERDKGTLNLCTEVKDNNLRNQDIYTKCDLSKIGIYITKVIVPDAAKIFEQNKGQQVYKPLAPLQSQMIKLPAGVKWQFSTWKNPHISDHESMKLPFESIGDYYIVANGLGTLLVYHHDDLQAPVFHKATSMQESHNARIVYIGKLTTLVGKKVLVVAQENGLVNLLHFDDTTGKIEGINYSKTNQIFQLSNNTIKLPRLTDKSEYKDYPFMIHKIMEGVNRDGIIGMYISFSSDFYNNRTLFYPLEVSHSNDAGFKFHEAQKAAADHPNYVQAYSLLTQFKVTRGTHNVSYADTYVEPTLLFEGQYGDQSYTINNLPYLKGFSGGAYRLTYVESGSVDLDTDPLANCIPKGIIYGLVPVADKGDKSPSYEQELANSFALDRSHTKTEEKTQSISFGVETKTEVGGEAKGVGFSLSITNSQNQVNGSSQSNTVELHNTNIYNYLTELPAKDNHIWNAGAILCYFVHLNYVTYEIAASDPNMKIQYLGGDDEEPKTQFKLFHLNEHESVEKFIAFQLTNPEMVYSGSSWVKSKYTKGLEAAPKSNDFASWIADTSTTVTHGMKVKERYEAELKRGMGSYLAPIAIHSNGSASVGINETSRQYSNKEYSQSLDWSISIPVASQSGKISRGISNGVDYSIGQNTTWTLTFDRSQFPMSMQKYNNYAINALLYFPESKSSVNPYLSDEWRKSGFAPWVLTYYAYKLYGN